MLMRLVCWLRDHEWYPWVATVPGVERRLCQRCLKRETREVPIPDPVTVAVDEAVTRFEQDEVKRQAKRAAELEAAEHEANLIERGLHVIRTGAHPSQGSTAYFATCLVCGNQVGLHGNTEYAQIMLAQFRKEPCQGPKTLAALHTN